MSQLKNNLKAKLRVVILCAGEGKRLKKVTKRKPKPLLKLEILGHKSILQDTIFKFEKLGIEQIVIIIGHLGSTIVDFISKLSKNNVSLQNKLIVINSENQYKFGPLFSFLSIIKNKTVYNEKNIYLLIPGDTIFDFNLLKSILSIISENTVLLQKYPFVFYQTATLKRLREIQPKKKIISNAELDIEGSEIILKRISQIKIKSSHSESELKELIPIFYLNYETINEILKLKKDLPINTVWEALNYLISNKKRVNAYKVENKYPFFDIDTKYDLKLLKKEEDNRCSDYSMNN
ncbi:MAG: sugar phosphate nucleotidyltransferase [Promethearchaeota archaeon]